MKRPTWDELSEALYSLFIAGDELPTWDEVYSVLLNIYSGEKRPDWPNFFMGVAELMGARSTCDRGKNGAVIVRDKKIIATGYTGSPPGFPHCDEVGHLIWKLTDDQGNESKHCWRTLHAEENAILQAAEFGIPIKGATLYTKMVPCYQRCAMKIIRVGIKRVVAKKRYHTDSLSIEMFKRAKVQLDILEDVVEDYENQ